MDGEAGLLRAGHIPGQLTWENNTALNPCQQTFSRGNVFQRFFYSCEDPGNYSLQYVTSISGHERFFFTFYGERSAFEAEYTQ